MIPSVPGVSLKRIIMQHHKARTSLRIKLFDRYRPSRHIPLFHCACTVPYPANCTPLAEMPANFDGLYTVFLITIAGVVPFCLVVGLVLGFVLWRKCCGLSEGGNDDRLARTSSMRVWYGYDGLNRPRRRSTALAEPDLGPSFASTVKGSHRSWFELGALEEGVGAKKFKGKTVDFGYR